MNYSHADISGPHARYYYFGGIEMGDVSNDGTSDVNYAASITDHKTKPGTGLFQNGATTETKYADFDASYDTINGLTYQDAPSTYTVQSGDTLESIAQQIWGDSNFWYLIADANGLSDGDSLVAGQNLIIPNKVADNQNNNGTYEVYNPNDAIGDVSPTTPPKPQPHHNGCGAFGAILMTIVAIVVAAVLPGIGDAVAVGLESLGVGADVAAVAGVVAAAAVSDVASQVFGLATGIEKSFSWKELGMSLITAGVGQGLGELGAFSGLTDTLGPDVVAGLRGATANAITQGIGVATGLQKSFNWAGVASAGVSAGVGNAVGQWAGAQDFSSNPGIDTAVARSLTGVASVIAGAATRSLITGTDFGDNIIKGLPDVIGQTVGNGIADQIGQDPAIAQQQALAQFETQTYANSDVPYTSAPIEVTSQPEISYYGPASASPDSAMDAASTPQSSASSSPSLHYDPATGMMMDENGIETVVALGNKDQIEIKGTDQFTQVVKTGDKVPVGHKNRRYTVDVAPGQIMPKLQAQAVAMGGKLSKATQTWKDSLGQSATATQYEVDNADGSVQVYELMDKYVAGKTQSDGTMGDFQWFDSRAQMNAFLDSKAGADYEEKFGDSTTTKGMTWIYAGASNNGWDGDSNTMEYNIDGNTQDINFPSSDWTAFVFQHEYSHVWLGYGSNAAGENNANWYGLWKVNLWKVGPPLPPPH